MPVRDFLSEPMDRNETDLNVYDVLVQTVSYLALCIPLT